MSAEEGNASRMKVCLKDDSSVGRAPRYQRGGLWFESTLSYKNKIQNDRNMKYLVFLGVIFGVIAVIYYVLLTLQCWGLIKFSKEDVSFPKVLIPFYYFFV